MNKPFAFFAALSVSVCIFACQSPAASDNGTTNDKTAATPPAHSPEFRTTVKPEAVASYSEKTDDPLNDWHFTVKLYETKRTLDYRLTMQFEEIRAQDTLTLPDFGTPPQPVIKKGADRYSCTIGFLDNENKFREYKKVYVKDGNTLKLVPLRRYTTTGKAE